MANENNGAGRTDMSKEKHAGDRHAAWPRGSVAVVVIAALLTSGAAYAGSWVGAQAQLKGQAIQRRATLENNTRQKRANVYRSFLNAANNYAVTTASIMNSCFDKHTCTPDLAAFQKARYTFQGALNNVYVDGTEAAVLASRRLAGSLPPSLGFKPMQSFTLTFDRERFVSSYQSFLTVMCREVPAIPRASC